MIIMKHCNINTYSNTWNVCVVTVDNGFDSSLHNNDLINGLYFYTDANYFVIS